MRGELVRQADAARRKVARQRFKDPALLKAAVIQQCAAEYGAIFGYQFADIDRDQLTMRVNAAVSGSALEQKARDAYSKLRKTIDEARRLAFELNKGSGGAPGDALRAMRGMLPLLPNLNAPVFSERHRTGRAAFIEETDEIVHSDQGRRLTDREMAAVTLLGGFSPLNYRTMLSRFLAKEGHGMTVADVLEAERKYVGAARKLRE